MGHFESFEPVNSGGKPLLSVAKFFLCLIRLMCVELLSCITREWRWQLHVKGTDFWVQRLTLSIRPTVLSFSLKKGSLMFFVFYCMDAKSSYNTPELCITSKSCSASAWKIVWEFIWLQPLVKRGIGFLECRAHLILKIFKLEPAPSRRLSSASPSSHLPSILVQWSASFNLRDIGPLQLKNWKGFEYHNFHTLCYTKCERKTWIDLKGFNNQARRIYICFNEK